MKFMMARRRRTPTISLKDKHECTLGHTEILSDFLVISSFLIYVIIFWKHAVTIFLKKNKNKTGSLFAKSLF